jgi:hypothetical protein
LGTCIQNPQRRFKNLSRRNRFAAGATFGNVLFRKMMPDALPFRIVQPKSSDIDSSSIMTGNFEIDSRENVMLTAEIRTMAIAQHCNALKQ